MLILKPEHGQEPGCVWNPRSSNLF